MNRHFRVGIGATAALVAAASLTGCSTSGAETSEASAAPTEAAAEAEASHTEWTYQGETGPSAWGDLDAAYSACSAGESQSPIDLPAEFAISDAATSAEVSKADGAVADTGHSFQFTPDDDDLSDIAWEGASFSAQQMHVHTPSEHTIGGQHSDAELHVVHTDEDGNLLVLGILVNEGAENRDLEDFVDAVAGQIDTEDVEIDLADVLGLSATTYSYTGSLTTPPCTEGVQWLVTTTPIEMSAEQISTIARAEGENFRPAQPLNGRDVSTATLAIIH